MWSIRERGWVWGLSWSSSFECRVLEVDITAASPVLPMLHQLRITDEASQLCGSRGCQEIRWMLHPGTVRHHARAW